MADRITAALAALEPEEVRVHFADEDVALLLVVSSKFEGASWVRRIQKCIKLLELKGDVLSIITVIVEPVTSEELKERTVPWPE